MQITLDGNIWQISSVLLAMMGVLIALYGAETVKMRLGQIGFLIVTYTYGIALGIPGGILQEGIIFPLMPVDWYVTLSFIELLIAGYLMYLLTERVDKWIEVFENYASYGFRIKAILALTPWLFMNILAWMSLIAILAELFSS